MKTRFAVMFYAACTLAFALFAGTALAGGHEHGGGKAEHPAPHHQTQSTHGRQPSSDQSQGDHSRPSRDRHPKPEQKSSHASQPKSQHDQRQSKPAPQHASSPAPAEHKVTICHATGSATNPYVEITVDEHALKNGHTTAKGDIIPAPAGGCPTAAPAPSQVQSVTFCDMTSPTSGKLETKPADQVVKHELDGTSEEARDIVPPFTYNGQTYSQIWTSDNEAILKNGCNAASGTQGTSETQSSGCTTTKTVTEQVAVGVKHFIGPKGSGRYVIIHPNPHSVHFQNKHPDEVIYQTVTKTVTVPAADCSSSSSSSSSQSSSTQSSQSVSSQTQSSQTQSATQQSTSAPATSTAAPAGSVLGAVTPINTTTKAKPKPAGGVLGATTRIGKTVGATTLPFTGLPLWIFALVALGLVTVGAVARRAGAQR